MNVAHTRAPSTADEVAGVSIPRTTLAVEAADAARAALPAALADHAARVFVFASLAARRAGEGCDADALYVAAMYANMGLAPLTAARPNVTKPTAPMPRTRCWCGIGARAACATRYGKRSRCIRHPAWPRVRRRSPACWPAPCRRI